MATPNNAGRSAKKTGKEHPQQYDEVPALPVVALPQRLSGSLASWPESVCSVIHLIRLPFLTRLIGGAQPYIALPRPILQRLRQVRASNASLPARSAIVRASLSTR